MTFRAQKILIVTGLIVLVGGLGALIYFTFFRGARPVPTTSPIITEEPSAPGMLPGSAPAGERPAEAPTEPGALPEATPIAIGGPTEVTKLTLTGVTNPVVSGDGSSVNFYDPADGKFYTISKDGRRRALLPDTFPNAKNVEWSPKSDRAIVEFPDGANVSVDLRTGETVTLPAHWEDFEFSPKGNGQIAAKSIGTDPSNRWLVLANADGSQAQTVAALGRNQDKVQVSWSPNDQVVAFSDTGALVSGFGRKQILAIGKNEENFPGLVVEGFSFEPIWNTDGSQILYSTHGPGSDYLPQVWLTDGTSSTLGQNRRSIALNTWADKCTYTSSSVAFCAVPKELPAGAGLQRSLAFGIPDRVYRIDTKTGNAVTIGEPESPTSMTNLQVSADGSTLFYQDAKSGTLQYFRLQ